MVVGNSKYYALLKQRRAILQDVYERYKLEGTLPDQSRIAALSDRELDTFRAPGTPLPFVALFPIGSGPEGCTPRAGTLRALLIGVDQFADRRLPPLQGPHNDVELLRAALASRGATGDATTLLAGRVTRSQIVDSLAALIRSTQCNDMVVLHYSGNGSVLKFTGPEYRLSGDGKSDLGLATYDSRVRDGRAAEGWLRGDELLSAVNAIRSKGAFVVVVIDGCDAGALNLAGRAQEGVWRWSPFKASKDYEQVAPGAGGYAALYAAAEGATTTELTLQPPGGRAEVYGLFSFAVATTLADPQVSSVRQLAEGIARYYRSSKVEDVKRYTENPVFEASDPDHSLFGGASVAPALAIELTEPVAARGPTLVETSTTHIAGRVVPAMDVIGVVVNGAFSPVTGDGRFSTTLALEPGTNVVQITSLTRDNRVGFYRLVIEHDVRNLAANHPRALALIIANQLYAPQSRQRDLETPLADGRAVAKVLRDRYGFETELVLPNGTRFPLVLENATRRQITTAFKYLRQLLSPDDELLIYYAGHGWRIKDVDQAYWIPVDAEYDNYSDYISATEITTELKLMNARHVLVISDSCYSGALSRGDVDAPSNNDSDQRRYIAELLRKRSRILISSGGDEPVADAGGGGHSVFARALLNALENDTRESVSAEQLFYKYIRESVIGNARQSPQHQILRDSGHDGGEFVFFRTNK
jgi:hypothetical protein